MLSADIKYLPRDNRSPAQVAAFTIDSFKHWQWAANSMHYLLSLWSRLVAAMPYLKGNASSHLEKFVPQALLPPPTHTHPPPPPHFLCLPPPHHPTNSPPTPPPALPPFPYNSPPFPSLPLPSPPTFPTPNLPSPRSSPLLLPSPSLPDVSGDHSIHHVSHGARACLAPSVTARGPGGP